MIPRMPATLAKRSHQRQGFTLVELLIVISVAVVLLVVAIPLAKQPLERQKVREASRQLNALISSAQARAVELRRPVGILLETRSLGNLSGNAVDNAAVNATEGITRIHFAEVPPLYGGDVSGAQAAVIRDTSNGFYYVHFDQNSYAGVRSFIGPGDVIRFNYRGRWFPITLVPEVITAGVEIRVRLSVANSAELPTGTVPFQIQRRPKKSVRPPVDLPGDTVIDLVGSGVGNAFMDFGVTFNSNTGNWDRFGYGSIMIMFQPSGAVDQVYYGPNAVRPQGPIHFLIGHADQVIPTAPFGVSGDDVANLRDAEALWVSVGHTTGRITTTENLPTDAPNDNPPGDFVVNTNSPFTATQQRIMAARELAMSSQSKGGR